MRGTRDGGRGWRRGFCALSRGHIGTVSFSAGSTLGLRAPDCAKESSTLWTLFTLRRGYVCAYTCRRHPGTRKDPPGSNLWPGGSCCIEMIPVRSIVQTRAAPKRRGVGLCARSGVEAALRPPQTAPKSRMWKRHCRLSGLSSRCGGAVLVRVCSACASLRSRIGLAMLSAGRTLGLKCGSRTAAAQNLRQRAGCGNGAESGCTREAERLRVLPVLYLQKARFCAIL